PVTPTPVTPTPVTPTPVTPTTATPTTKPTNINANTSGEETPFTGVKGGLGIAVIIAVIVAVVAGIRYSKYNSVK
ncbi:MAG: hypothetical protein IJH39_07970, partial [Clostridia bacterium]|nr:hypothetical protein [Clostridia bacterium]